MNKLQELRKILIERGLNISVAESCTGGMLAQHLTKYPGSSSYFDRGFVTYTNQSKIDVLGVNSSIIDEFGAVSLEVDSEMVKWVNNKSKTSISMAITGIAGPGGATIGKPVGTVCFGFIVNGELFAEKKLFSGDRDLIIQSSVNFAIECIFNQIKI
jgi:nicotinamide-nucleotide amidase